MKISVVFVYEPTSQIGQHLQQDHAPVEICLQGDWYDSTITVWLWSTPCGAGTNEKFDAGPKIIEWLVMADFVEKLDVSRVLSGLGA
jgi:hypothetical protein